MVWVQNDDLELIEKMSHLLLAPAVMFPDLGGLPGDKFDVQYLPATIEDDCH